MEDAQKTMEKQKKAAEAALGSVGDSYESKLSDISTTDLKDTTFVVLSSAVAELAPDAVDVDKNASQASEWSNIGNSSSSGSYSGSYGGTFGSSHGGASGGGSSSSSSEKDDKDSSTSSSKRDEIVDVTDQLNDMGYVSVEIGEDDKCAKSLFENEDFEYKDGYAMIGAYYLIVCDASIGTVGDVIKITLKDGKVVTCIVAANTNDLEEKDVINFIVEDGKIADAKKKVVLTKKLENVEKIEKVGDCKKVLGIDYYDLYGDSVANKALELACSAVGTDYLTLADAQKVGCDLSGDGRLHVPNVEHSHRYRAELPQTENLMNFWAEEKAAGKGGMADYGPASCSPWIGSVLRSMGYDDNIGTPAAANEGLVSPWTGETITNAISAHGEATYMYHHKETFEEINVDPNKTIAEQCEPGDIIGGPSHIMIYVGNEWAQKYFPGTTGNVVEAAERGHCYPGVTNAGNGKVGNYKIFRVKKPTNI